MALHPTLPRQPHGQGKTLENLEERRGYHLQPTPSLLTGGILPFPAQRRSLCPESVEPPDAHPGAEAEPLPGLGFALAQQRA